MDPVVRIMLSDCINKGLPIKELLEIGADPNGEDVYDFPLINAIENGDQDSIKLLIDFGANVFEAIDDVAAIAIRNPPALWTILEGAPLTIRHHFFGTMQRMGRTEQMIEFILRGHADVCFDFRYHPGVHVTPWKSLPKEVQDAFIAKTSCVTQMMNAGAGERFMNLAARNQRCYLFRHCVEARCQTWPDKAALYWKWYKLINSPWSRKRHRLQSPQFKLVVKVLFLTWRRSLSLRDQVTPTPDPRSLVLALLPIEMVECILANLARF